MKRFFTTDDDLKEFMRQWIAQEGYELPPMTAKEAQTKLAGATNKEKRNINIFKRKSIELIEKVRFQETLKELEIEGVEYSSITIGKISKFMKCFQKNMPPWNVWSANTNGKIENYSPQDVKAYFKWIKNMKKCFKILELDSTAYAKWVSKIDGPEKEKLPRKTQKKFSFGTKCATISFAAVIILTSVIIPLLPRDKPYTPPPEEQTSPQEEQNPQPEELKPYKTNIKSYPIDDAESIEEFYSMGFLLFDRNNIPPVYEPIYSYTVADDNEDLILGYKIEYFYVQSNDGNFYYIEEFLIRTYEKYDFSTIEIYDKNVIDKLETERIENEMLYFINGDTAYIKFTQIKNEKKYDYFITLKKYSEEINLETLMEDLFLN